jgi:hypothetical protein
MTGTEIIGLILIAACVVAIGIVISRIAKLRRLRQK